MAIPLDDRPIHPRPPAPFSRLAIIALGLNIPFFVPPITLLAALLGVVSLIRLRRTRELRGQGLAIAAIVVGVALTTIFTTLYGTGYRLAAHGATDAIRAADRGDAESVRSLFAALPRELADDEIAAFAETLRSRYGALLDGRVIRTTEDLPRRGGVFAMPYLLRFERGDHEAVIGITLARPRDGRPTLALASIRVKDEEAGDVMIPRASRTLQTP